MTEAAWSDIPPELVPVRSIHVTQQHLWFHGLVDRANGGRGHSGDEHPHLVRIGGELFALDGHHAIAVALVRGHEDIPARVVDGRVIR